jgi:hypothetical protein
MNGYDCDAVRDLLPAIVRDDGGAGAAAAREHLARCASCRAEAAVVRMVQDALEPVPPGLEERVLSAVRVAATPRRRSPARLAMAATLAAAVLGGALIVERFGTPWTAERDDLLLAEFDASAASLLGWVGGEDPLLHSGASLEELTVEELELLLAELER